MACWVHVFNITYTLENKDFTVTISQWPEGFLATISQVPASWISLHKQPRCCRLSPFTGFFLVILTEATKTFIYPDYQMSTDNAMNMRHRVCDEIRDIERIISAKVHTWGSLSESHLFIAVPTKIISAKEKLSRNGICQVHHHMTCMPQDRQLLYSLLYQSTLTSAQSATNIYF